MKSLSFSVILLFFVALMANPYAANSQLTPTNMEELSIELGNRVNALRIGKGLKPLITDDILKKAAVNQSEYMVLNGILTHDQQTEKMASPQKRVLFYGGYDFDIVGENVLYSTPQSFPFTKNGISLLAEEMYQSWKNSPGHYANMINPDYVFGSFGFKVDPIKKIVYATQVFGKKGIVISNQISPNGFGLKQGDADCDLQFNDFENVLANMGNALRVEGNQIILYYHNIKLFQKIFQKPNDGLAVDLVFRKQVLCDRPNQLDLSPVHDGILLKPVYRDELMNSNLAKSSYRVIVPVGEIPANLINEEFSASLIIIQNGKKCRYLVPGEVPSKRYDLRPIEPILTNPSVPMVDSGIIASQELVYDFNTNITKPIKYPAIDKYSHQVYSVGIKSYTSVEGDSAKNTILHNARAITIKEHIRKSINVPDSLIKIDAHENWEKMHFQFHYFFHDEMASLPHETVKKIIAEKDKSLPWDSALFQQRQSTAVINYWGKYNTADSIHSEKIIMNLRTAIVTNNIPLANKALYEMYYHESLFYDWQLFESATFEACKKHPELVGNYSAMLSRYFMFDLQKTTNFIFNWIYRESELSEEAKFNLLHLYSLVGTYLLDDWDIESARLSNVVHPYKIQQVAPNEISNELMLNLQLTYIQYFGQINDAENIHICFQFIADYFGKHSLGPEDDAKLTLFYNSWSMYPLTTGYLDKKLKEGKINEDGVFILAQTMNFYRSSADQARYEAIQKKAVSLNKTRWCKWVGKDYQMLRNTAVKQLYCETCNE